MLGVMSSLKRWTQLFLPDIYIFWKIAASNGTDLNASRLSNQRSFFSISKAFQLANEQLIPKRQVLSKANWTPTLLS